MSWNHRLLMFEEEVNNYFQMHEVYYENDIPNGHTQNPTGVHGDSVDDIKWQLEMMTKALDKPILWGGDRFPEEYKKEE